jgi:hypothetical protein
LNLLRIEANKNPRCDKANTRGLNEENTANVKSTSSGLISGLPDEILQGKLSKNVREFRTNIKDIDDI